MSPSAPTYGKSPQSLLFPVTTRLCFPAEVMTRFFQEPVTLHNLNAFWVSTAYRFHSGFLLCVWMKREDGENPSRSRRCNRGRNSHADHCQHGARRQQRAGRRELPERSGSQKTCPKT
jgi:hypothetical protein